MDGKVSNLYKLPDIEKYEDLCLLTLSERCAALEEQVYKIAKDLPGKKRMIIEDYISTRSDLELETVKTSLRWGKRHYK